MSPIDLDRLLSRFHPDRRTFLKGLVLGTAYAAPVVASFSMDGLGAMPASALSNLCSNVTSNVATDADVVVSKTASPDPVVAGTNLTFTITVVNCGPGTAANVSFQDVMPLGTDYVRTTQTSGPAFSLFEPAAGSSGQTLTGTIASLAAGASATFDVVVTVKP
jgi:uncharacterized repeat protein (TIGR01451 family)